MPECVSFRLYLLPDAWKNFDIARDLRSSAMSNFPTHLEVRYSRKETHNGIILYMYLFPTVKYVPHATKQVAHHMMVYGCGEPGSNQSYWECASMDDLSDRSVQWF